MEKPRIAVLGAGLIGRKHIELVGREAALAAIVDPSEAARSLAGELETAWFADLTEYLSVDRPDGAVIATPNQLHVENGMACIAAGIPILVEKPISDDVLSAERLVNVAEAANVPVLVGHHRRYNPIIDAAKQAVHSGQLGDIISVAAQFWLDKPADYFSVEWRTKKGAGPVFINLIHDIDLLRHLCGEIVAVQAMESSFARGHEVEDTAVVLLRFHNGALGTVTVSDAVVAPWSWELTSGENPDYPATGAACYQIGGNKGSLSVPDLALWQHPGKQGWWEPIDSAALPYKGEDPLVLQIRHFCAVATEGAEPIVSGREGLLTLKVIEAIKLAAATGKVIELQ